MKRTVGMLLGSIAVAIGIAACSGGNTIVTPPVGNSAGAMFSADRTSGIGEGRDVDGSARIVIQIPPKTATDGQGRLPRYTSPSTQSMVITAGALKKTLNLSAISPGCSKNKSTGDVDCAEVLELPAGVQTIHMVLYDRPKGEGDALSSATKSVRIIAGKTTKVSIVTDGIPDTATVLLGDPGAASVQIPQGTPTSVPVIISAYDAKGNLIVPPGSYATPIGLSDSDTGAGTKLSKTKITAPDASLVLKYNGSTTFTSATITPSIAGKAQKAGAASLSAVATAAITEYSIPNSASNKQLRPDVITTGSDGNLWFTQLGVNEIGRVTTAGKITEYSAPQGSDLTSAPGGLWYGVPGAVVRMTTGGTVTEYSLPNTMPNGVGTLTVGPDGAIWGTDSQDNIVARITTTGVITSYPVPTPTVTVPPASPAPSGNPVTSSPSGIITGPDGNLWFGDSAQYLAWEYYSPCECWSSYPTGALDIDEMSTNGLVTQQFTVPNVSGGTISGITKRPDGTVWFAVGAEVEQITPGGGTTITTYPAASGVITDLTTGPDGALWFSEYPNPSTGPYIIGRIGMSTASQTRTVTITEYAGPSGSEAQSITAGPDKALWFTDWGNQKIGRVPVDIAASTAGRQRQVQGRTIRLERRHVR